MCQGSGDMFAVIDNYHVQEFTNHLNTQDPHIKFTV